MLSDQPAQPTAEAFTVLSTSPEVLPTAEAFDLTVTPGAADGRDTAVLADSPLAYYKLDNGATLSDTSGNNRVLTSTGTITEVGGIVPEDDGGAIQVGASSYLERADASITNLTEYTVEAWFQPKGSVGHDGGAVVGTSFSGGGRIPFVIAQDGSDIYLGYYSGSNWYRFHQFTATVDQVYHLALTCDGTIYRAYVDGVEVATDATSFGTTSNTTLYIGRRWDRAYENPNGVIDSVAVFGSALPAARIFEHYASTALGSYRSEVLADSPAVYARMDEAVGEDQLFDSSGNDRHADDGHSYPATFGVPGLTSSGTAANFNGVDDKMAWSDAAWMDATSLTMEAWIKPDTVGAIGYIISRWNPDNNDRCYRLDVADDGGGGFVRAYWRFNDDATNLTVSSPAGSIVAGNTYHVVATYDETTGYQAMYINGVEVANATHSGGGALRAGAEALFLGCNRTLASNYAHFYDGVLDEVAIYPSALSAERIETHYLAGTSPLSYEQLVLDSEPAVYLPLDDATGKANLEIARDLSGNDRNGAYRGSVPDPTGSLLPAIPDASGAASFGGAANTDRVDLYDAAWMDTADITVECWAAPTDYSDFYDAVTRWTGTGASGSSFILGVNGSSGVFRWLVRVGSTNYVCEHAGLTGGVTHHFVGTYNSATGDAILYIDGVAVDTVNTGGGSLVTGTQRITVGARVNEGTGAGAYWFLGDIDEVAIYTTVLDPQTIAAHHTAGTAAPQSGENPPTDPTLAGAMLDVALAPQAAVEAAWLDVAVAPDPSVDTAWLDVAYALPATAPSPLAGLWDAWNMHMFAGSVVVSNIFGSDNPATLVGGAVHASATDTTLTNAASQARGVYFPTRLDLTGEQEAAFRWTMTLTDGADGVSFVLLDASQGATHAAAPAVGGAGGQQAVIPNEMFAVSFRTWVDDDLLVTDHGGALGSGEATGVQAAGIWTGTHTYEVVITPPTGVKVYQDGALLWSGTVTLPPGEAWVGLVGSTGATWQTATLSGGVLTRHTPASAPMYEAFASAVHALSPVLYLRMDEPAGTDALDAAGDYRHGVYSGGATLAQPGLLEVTESQATAVTFDGVDGKVSVPTGGWLDDAASFTVLAVVSADSTTSGAVVGRYDDAQWPNANPWIVQWVSGQPRLFVNDGGNFQQLDAPGTYVTGVRYLLAAVVEDGVGSTIYAFHMDTATLVGQNSHAQQPTGGVGLPVTIGQVLNGAGAHLPFTGTIDEIAVFDTALTQLQLQAIVDTESRPTASSYASNVGADSPYAWWRVADTLTAGTVVENEVAAGLDATVAGADLTSTYGSDGGPAAGGGFGFDAGTADRLDADVPAWLSGSSGGFAFECWVRWSGYSNVATIAGILNDGVTTMFQLQQSDRAEAASAGQLSIYVRDDTGVSRQRDTTRTDLDDDQWHHIVVSVDFDNVDHRIYVDGVWDQTGGTSGSGTPSNTWGALDYPLMIGARNLRGTPERQWSGSIAEVALYQAPLPPARVAAHYLAASQALTTYSHRVLLDTPEAFWQLDEASGTTMVDACGAYDGTLAADVTHDQPPVTTLGRAVTPGAGSAGAVPHTTLDTNMVSGQPRTWECWVRLDDATEDALQAILDKTNLSPNSNTQWFLAWENRSSQGSPQTLRLAWRIGSSSSNLEWSVSGLASEMEAGAHIVITRDAANHIAWYFNGRLIGGGPTFVATPNSSNSLDMVIGGSALGNGYQVRGVVDNVAVYDAWLTHEQVLAHWHDGVGGFTATITSMGPALWLDALDIEGDTGDAVATWSDRSGNNRDATLLNGELVEGPATGVPAVHFDDPSTVANFMPANGDGELVMLFRSQDGASGSTTGWDYWGTHEWGCHWPYDGNAGVYTDWGRNARLDAIDTLAAGTWYIADQYSDQTDWGWFRGDPATEVYTTGSHAPYWDTVNDHTIGPAGAIGSALAAAVMFPRRLTTVERHQVWAYLAATFLLPAGREPAPDLYGAPVVDEWAGPSGSGSSYSAQSFDLTATAACHITQVEWRPSKAGEYEFTVDDVAVETVTLGVSEWYAFAVQIDLEAGQTVELGWRYTSGSQKYHYNSADSGSTANFSWAHWKEAGGGETVGAKITYQLTL